MPRSDKGKKRTSFLHNLDTTGKTVKENVALRSFWSHHKLEDIKLLTSTELSEIIDKWIIEYEQIQRKRDKNWWYPPILYDPYPEPKQKKKSTFNPSFR